MGSMEEISCEHPECCNAMNFENNVGTSVLSGRVRILLQWPIRMLYHVA